MAAWVGRGRVNYQLAEMLYPSVKEVDLKENVERISSLCYLTADVSIFSGSAGFVGTTQVGHARNGTPWKRSTHIIQRGGTTNCIGDNTGETSRPNEACPHTLPPDCDNQHQTREVFFHLRSYSTNQMQPSSSYAHHRLSFPLHSGGRDLSIVRPTRAQWWHVLHARQSVVELTVRQSGLR